ncbi:histidinol-phosphatase HisJ family protein [Caldisalinibacter kiritimatiensis]|uniref:Histidinol-phosphatase n=1 Tax=Caldisalinibacter kiritimatiensis TaxID=1304284 RepID=R1CYJ8_9FIRM|nr:histidinol-phosphatase HisJ family protein [Caldisalinibacter kiritimatiensis]EOD01654.1 Histidinol-phosphatase [Caldisalinibacter kiritimatiensis]
MYDLHVHSSFSNDCRHAMEDMLKGALVKNVKTIAFTDHVDFEYGDCNLDLAFTPDDYIREYKRLKTNYKNDIQILSGLEIGMQPHLSKKANDFIQDYPFDFIIMSVHAAKGKGLYEGTYYKNRTPLQVYEDYYDDLIKILDNFDNFDVVGHLDLVERYRIHISEIRPLDEYKEILVEALKKIIKMGKGIEVNTSGIRYGIESFHPTKDILKIYKDLGGEIITIGSDAHKPEDICFAYHEATQLLKELGFKHISIFKNRKKHYIKL